ncbi:tyrosine-type recombinase/integrase [Nonomuraea sp. GTA35]|uniref:tyrosine-type recombinase/integrase n=1 Tax=Nonomuraea sp. GTA35 TaxID=1676746 RepID=UPI0035BF780D
MASAEKRGKYWRARPILADGTKGSFMYGPDGKPFTTKKAAVEYAEEVEADIRRDRWQDPRSGDITLGEWMRKWLPAQHLEETTIASYRWHIQVHIGPDLADVPLRNLDAMQINAWELSLHGTWAPSSSASARTLLHTILADAVSAGLIPANPAVRQRNRGRKAGRVKTRGPERKWASPREVLHLGERLSLLSGRPDDLIWALAVGYTGMRWAEAWGLERPYFRLSTIRVEFQVYEHQGRWIKKAPKDDSYRTIHLPAFLSDLLSRQVQSRETGACTCTGPRGCGGGRYVFLAEDGGHERRSNYARRRFRPAADGRHPEARNRPGYPVLADVAQAPWPGVVRRSWPAAVAGEEFAPPRRQGFWRYDPEQHHLYSWLPIMDGLTPHGLRHAHKVWLDELGVPLVASEERLGHELPGIVGTYSHTSPAMIKQITEGLQRLWEESLLERAKIGDGRSPVPLLDELLEPARKILSQDRPPLVPKTVISISR